MIGILLNDASYEQDIRELLMAFYPGEGFAHERTGGVDFYVEGTYEPESGTFSLDILENEEKKAGAAFPISYENRLEAKTAIKRELYGLLSARTGKTLPWGTLTGIRPTKIALSRLDQGVPEEEIREFMEKTYLTSREKIDLSLEIAEREKELLSHIDYENGYSPVSYTHLDVYKRQVLIPELKKRGYQLVTVSEMASLRGGMTPGQVYHSFRP